jgi:hypothetical protein
MYRFIRRFVRISLAAALSSVVGLGSAHAFSLRCLQGPNPSGATVGVSDPTVYGLAEWDSWDLIGNNTIYMNSLAFGPGCPESSCVLLLPEVTTVPMANFPYHRRYQMLTVFLGGRYILSSASKLMNPGIQETAMLYCSVTGLVAPAWTGGGH